MTSVNETRLLALVEHWRQRQAEAFVEYEGTGVGRCADELAAALRRAAVDPRPGEWSDAQIGRLIDQSQQISRMLSEAGVGSCPLVEGVRALLHRQSAACHTHGDPLVCLACEAEESARPEWRPDLDAFKALARTHRVPRDLFAESLSEAIVALIAEIERRRD